MKKDALRLFTVMAMRSDPLALEFLRAEAETRSILSMPMGAGSRCCIELPTILKLNRGWVASSIMLDVQETSPK